MICNSVVNAFCYFYLLFISCAASSEVRKPLVYKRDIGLQTCIQNFDVHKDKIIRTQDSKEMGAKYINEIDLGSREECLRLCCEIDSCDVFVFEEKNTGSCYLFQCGPPEDFKCKFTHHANYSSGILAVNRHLPDLEKQINKLSKHEQDLTKLRVSNAGKDTQVSKSQEKTTTTSTTATHEIKAAPASTSAIPSNAGNTIGSKCSRYQFECRSTKECIAIYNACDGIPQCADGSDEAYELGCPEATTKSITQTQQKQRISETEISTLPKNGLNKENQFSQPQTQNYYSSSSKQQPDGFQVSNVQGSEADFVRPNSRIVHPVSYDNQPRYPQMTKSQSNNWPQRPPIDIGQQYQQYEDTNRAYNYKDTGFPISEGQEISRPHFEDARDNRKPNYYNGVYPQIPQQYEEKWSRNNQDSRFPNPNGNQYATNINQNLQQPWLSQTNTPDENTGPVQEPVDNWKPEISPVHHEHEKMAHELKHSKELMENIHNKVSGNSPKIETHSGKDHIQYAKVTQYKVDLDLEDGIAETPGGAVLSLTLGLIITCVMALLIGCRLRIVRRRIRRGGKSYAHDADYLVNGMYL